VGGIRYAVDDREAMEEWRVLCLTGEPIEALAESPRRD